MTAPRHDDGRGRPSSDGRPRREGRPARQTPSAKPLPYRVARWGKFWSLEPLFADDRSCLVAKGGEPPKLDELVLAVPVHGDRRRIVEVLGTADDVRAVLRAMLYARGLPQGFDPEVLEEAAATSRRCRPSPSTPTRRAISTTPSAWRATARGTAPTSTSPMSPTSSTMTAP